MVVMLAVIRRTPGGKAEQSKNYQSKMLHLLPNTQILTF